MAEQVNIQVKFNEIVNINGNMMEYQDALYMTQAEYAAKTQAEIDTLKQSRVDNWINSIKFPPPPVESTKEQLLEQKAILDAELVSVNLKLLTAKSGTAEVVL